jgi:hypothetical protein
MSIKVKLMTPTDIALYNQVKKDADAKFLAPTSAYKSAWMVKQYKDRGGAFLDPKPSTNVGLGRWFQEKWINLNSTNKPCGRTSSATKGLYPVCRPSVRVTAKTPKLASELSIAAISKAKKEKQVLKQNGKVKF